MTEISNPIFIVGYMHSGTTLLQNILGNHPLVYCGSGETKLFEFLPTLKNKFKNLNNHRILCDYIHYVARTIVSGFGVTSARFGPLEVENVLLQDDLHNILGSMKEHVSYELVILKVAEYLTLKAAKACWLEKTPTNIFYIDEIIKSIPNVLFVEIVRNPYAILASKKVRRSTVFSERYSVDQQIFKNLEKAYDPLLDLFSWKSAIRSGVLTARNYPGHILRIRYEDLVMRPEEILKKVLQYLKLDFEVSILEVLTKNTAYWYDQQGTGISTQFVNRWKDELSAPEVNIVNLLARSELARLGYSPEYVPLINILLIPVIFVRSGFEFIRRIYRRYKMGGRKFLFVVMKGYVRRLFVFFRVNTNERI